MEPCPWRSAALRRLDTTQLTEFVSVGFCEVVNGEFRPKYNVLALEIIDSDE